MPSPALHLRAPLLWLLLPLMAGLTGAKLWPPPAAGLWPLSLLALLAGILAAVLALQPGRVAFAAWAGAVSVAAALGGFLLLHVREPALHRWDRRPPREVSVTIRVQQAFPAAATARSLTGLGVITAAGEDDRELVGRRIYYSAIRRISVAPRRSGGYVIRGVLEPLPRETDANSFNDYLANLGVHLRLTRAQLVRETEPPGWFQDFYARAEARFESILRRGLEDQPEAESLYLAMLLGGKAEMSAEQQNAFMRSGTFHIFSISGMHVGVISTAVYLLFGWLRMPRRVAVAAGLLLLWFYVQLTGASSPAVRAFVMIAFLSATWFFRVPGNALAGLTAAALLTLVLDPLQLFSTGFQMSYAVVAALVLMGRPLGERWLAAWRPFALRPRADWRWFHHRLDWAGRGLINGVAASWVAFLASTPSGIGYFGVLSPGSLPANLLIIPLSSFAIYAGLVSLVAGSAGLTQASILCNLAAARGITVMDWLLRHGIALPGVYFPAHFRAPWLAPVVLAALTAVLLIGAGGGWARRRGGYWPPVVLLGLLVILGVKFG